MTELADPRMRDLAREAGHAAVAAAFGSLARVCLTLDARFRVQHASPDLAALLGEAAARAAVGRPAEELLGPELFGPAGAMRQALEQGERREGWRAVLQMLDDAGAELYACGLAMEMFKLQKEDLVPQVDGVLSAMDFFEKAEGAQIIFV